MVIICVFQYSLQSRSSADKYQISLLCVFRIQSFIKTIIKKNLFLNDYYNRLLTHTKISLQRPSMQQNSLDVFL